nr:EOG090X08JU [Eurycercus lamellatus]
MVLQAAAAAAAGFPSGNLAMGMDLSGLVPSVAGLMSPSEQQNAANQQRKQREFIPDNKKDDSYWDRRRRNNEAAKRSREKRRLNDMVLEGRVLELTKENHILRAQLSVVRDKYGINPESLISLDQVLASLPSPDQVLSLPRPRSRLLTGLAGSISPAPSNRSLSPPITIQQQQQHQQQQQLQQQQQQQQHPQQQRQSVLMSSMNRQRSPSPYQGYRNYSNEPVQQQIRSNGAVRHQELQQRPLPPLPALTPVPSAVEESGSIGHQHEVLSDKVAQYFDLCSSSSSSSDGSHSPIDPSVAAGRLLPLKLRHKIVIFSLSDSGKNLNKRARLENHSAGQTFTTIQSLMPISSCSKIKMTKIKDIGERETRIIQMRPATKRMRMTPPSHHHHHHHQQPQQARRFAQRNTDHEEEPEERTIANDSADENNEELRSHIARLASELESLKTLMLGNAGSNASSAAHRNKTNHNNNNNSNSFRLH